MECAATVHGGIAQRGAEIAMTKVLGRIEREGADAVRFEEAEGVRRYARKVLATSRRDAARRVAVERRYAGGVGGASARLERDLGGDREADWALERDELDEWMDRHLSADDAEILVAVAVEDREYPELAAEWGIREGTLRTRFHRARTRFVKPWSGEFGAVAKARSRSLRADGASRTAPDELGFAA
jgi:RNA polymerase sigma factor (sigma-70 family)